LPPGRARLATRPVATGSPAAANRIGMTAVARLAAAMAGDPSVIMISTLSRTNSAAISVKRSLRRSAQRCSIATLRPSIQPSTSSCSKTSSVTARMLTPVVWPGHRAHQSQPDQIACHRDDHFETLTIEWPQRRTQRRGERPGRALLDVSWGKIRAEPTTEALIRSTPVRARAASLCRS